MSLHLADLESAEAVSAVDWSVLAEPQVESVARTVARPFARDYGLTLEYEGTYQEAVMVSAERTPQVRGFSPRGRRPPALLVGTAAPRPLADRGQAPRRACPVRGRTAPRGKERSVTAYDRHLVQLLLPAVWDADAAYGIRSPTAPDADMPKRTVDPRAASILFAHLADMRQGQAAAPLTFGERQALILR